MARETLEELSQRLNQLEKKIKQYEDIEEIKQLHRRYENYHTFGDEWGRLDCYTENAVLEISGTPFKGKAAIAEHMNLSLSENPPIFKDKDDPLPDGHFVIHPIIKVNGDKATGTWLMYEMHSHPRTYQTLFWIQGLYDCEYVRENGEWKFSYLRWRPRIHPPGLPPWDAPFDPNRTDP